MKRVRHCLCIHKTKLSLLYKLTKLCWLAEGPPRKKSRTLSAEIYSEIQKSNWNPKILRWRVQYVMHACFSCIYLYAIYLFMHIFIHHMPGPKIQIHFEIQKSTLKFWNPLWNPEIHFEIKKSTWNTEIQSEIQKSTWNPVDFEISYAKTFRGGPLVISCL